MELSPERWQAAAYRHGLELLNRGDYFEAHEVLEDIWRAAPQPDRAFLQGVIQVAVALHHYHCGNREGAYGVMARAERNLESYPAEYGAIDVAALRAAVSCWHDTLRNGGDPPAAPQVRMLESLRVKDRDANSQNASESSEEPVPMLDLRRGYDEIRDEVLTAVTAACDSQQFVLGEQVAAFEREAAAFLGARRAVACASGTDALWLALRGVGIEPGDEVITTPFSFFATVSAIVRAGARPVLADVEDDTLNLDPQEVEKHLRRGHSVRAILPVHLYGQCADMTAFQRIAREHKLKMVEDAAQAMGASWDGKRAGTLGEAAAFSFYPTKNLSAFGDAGMVTTGDEAVAEKMAMMRNHGSRRRYQHEAIGANSRMDGIQGAVLRVKLKHVERWNEARRARAAVYDRLFAEAGLPQVKKPATRPQAYHIFHQYVIRAQRRDELRQFLTARRIGSEVYYPQPLHLQPCFAYLGYGAGDFPRAERAAREVLALPMFPELTEAEQRRVVRAIAEFYS